MNYFAPGVREIGRRGVRLVTTLRLQLALRKRNEALTELGLLGWQQADFDERTQQQVDEIHDVERVQSHLVNEAAERGSTIRALTSEREAARRTHLEQRKQVEAELRKSVEVREQTERQLAAMRKKEPNFERRIPELDRELRDLNKLYSELLLMEKQTPKMRQELIRVRERIVAIPNEKSDLRTQHLRTASDLRRLEENLRPLADAAKAVEQRLRKMDADWEERDAALQAEIKTKEKERIAAERHFRELETAKNNPYLKVGEVLAGSGIAPLNQPEALAKVRRAETQVAQLEVALDQSREATAAEEPQELRASLILCISIAVVTLLLFLLVLFH